MKRALALAASVCWLVTNPANGEHANGYSTLTREVAIQRGMFILSFSGTAEATIFTDTTDPEQLQLAERLQELIYRIGSVRLPICDGNHYRGEGERCILIRNPGMPARGSVPDYMIFMTEVNRGNADSPRQIQILAQKPYATEAVSEFTKAAFGISLAELDNSSFPWPKEDIVAISGDFKTITRGQLSGQGLVSDIKYVHFDGGSLHDLAVYLSALTHKVVIVTPHQGASVKCRFAPEIPLERSLDELAASLRENDACLTNVDSRYFRIVAANLAARPPASTHLEVRIEKDQIIVDQQPVSMDQLIELVNSNADVEVWVHDAGNSANLSLDSVTKSLFPPCMVWLVPPPLLFSEYLPTY